MKRIFDVIVLGGGPAGSAAAIELSRLGYSVLVIERSEYASLRVGETLPPAIKAPLSKLGVWQRFLRDGHARSNAIWSIWGNQAPYESNHFFNPYGAGWHIDRARFDATLAGAAEAAGATVLRGVRSCRYSECVSYQWKLEFSECRKLETCRARFLVDATGRASLIARKMGAIRIGYDHLIGAVNFLLTDPDASIPLDHTVVEATEDGWWYSAALPTSRMILAYMTDADIYAHGARTTSCFWREQLSGTTLTRTRVLSTVVTSKPQIVNANSSHLESSIGTTWLAAGDAAAAFDPLSSRGVFAALESGCRAALAIDNHFRRNNKALTTYAGELNEAFKKFMIQRRHHYQLEMRWPDSVFWQRRHSTQSLVSRR